MSPNRNRSHSIRLMALPGLFLLVLAVLPFRAQERQSMVILQSQNPAPVKFAEDLPAGSMQAKATASCLECHEARIIVQQRLGKAAWTKEVDKMMKWGAVVDPADRDALIDYLSSNFGPDRPAYDAPRTSAPTTAKRAGSKKPQ
jgi:hypothetical protein